MENAREVIDLFTCSEVLKSREIAARLESLNRERQRVGDEILHEIVKIIECLPDKDERYSLVLSGAGWHRGVIGIVAQRVVEQYHRPALVIGVEDGVGVGSGRSIRGLHLLTALTAAQDLFERFGGHGMAAGFALPAAKIPQLETRFEEHARSVLRPCDLERVLRVDAELCAADIDWPLLAEIAMLAPFGCGNPTPVLAARDFRLVLGPRILQEKHLKLRVACGTKCFDAIGWGMAERGATVSAGQSFDMAFTLEQNVFQDVSSLQLVISGIRCGEPGNEA
jgi:single-stranded-DNA-specific exonuclease